MVVQKKLMLVYSDIVGVPWIGLVDFSISIAQLRSQVYEEALRGLLPQGTSPVQLVMYYLKDGVEYEPHETLRARLFKHILIRPPRQLKLLKRVSDIARHVEDGRVYFILALPEGPLVTVPPDDLSSSSTSESSGISRNNPFARPKALLEERPDGSGSLSKTLPVELFNPSFARFMSVMADPMPAQAHFVILANNFVGDITDGCRRGSLQEQKLASYFSSLISQGGEGTFTQHDGADKSFSLHYLLRGYECKTEISVPFMVFKFSAKADAQDYPRLESDSAALLSVSRCRKRSKRVERQEMHDRCRLPVFAIIVIGPWLSVYGCIFNRKWICDPLMTPLRLFSDRKAEASPQEMLSCARLFIALRDVLENMQNWRTNRINPAPTRVITPSGQELEFSYVTRMVPHSNLFLAQSFEKPSRILVVKFVERYGVEAHRLLSDRGLAPKLLYCGGPYEAYFPGYTRMQMVVMEWFRFGDPLNPAGSSPSKKVCEEVRKAVALLHENGFVHGDVRWRNVLLDDKKTVNLVDFDWAGKEGEARYPEDLSEEVPWPAGVESGELIRKVDDEYWLEKLFPLK